MTNTVNLQKMLQAEAPSVKKQESISGKNEAGDDFKSMVAKKTEELDPKEETKPKETKPQEKKPEEENTDQKEKKELKPGESIPLTDLLLIRPEVLSDAEKAVVMAQLSTEDAGQNVNQLQVQDTTVQITSQGAQEAIQNMAKVQPEADAAPAPAVIKPMESKVPETQVQMSVANQPSVHQEAASQAASEMPAAEMTANKGQKAEKQSFKHQAQVANSSESVKPQHVDKPQEKQIIVDEPVPMEQKPVETAKSVNDSLNSLMEKAPEENAGEIKDLTQLSAEEKTDKEGKTENVLSSDVLKPETLQKEVVTVKVAEPYDRLNTETVKDLANKLTEQFTNGKREFTIQLNPEMLGRIAVKISMADDGIKVTLSCDRQKTCQLLAEQASGINRIVEHNTGQPAVVEVKEGYWEQQKDATDQHARQNQNQEQNQQDKASKAETDDFIQQLRLGFLDYRISV